LTHNSEGAGPAAQKPETAQVWREAGFIPPPFYQKLIEFMHRTCMGEPGVAAPDLRRERDTGFVITDQGRLREFAASCNIRWQGRKRECVAIEILIALLNDYTREIPQN